MVKNLDPNNKLCVIDEDMNINSFSVLEITDVAVTHTSTIGLEMAMLGKPSIILGATHYKGKQFTIDPLTVTEYIEAIKAGLIKMTNKGPCARTQQIAKKYFYMMMFLYQKIMPMYHESGAFNSYGYSSFESLIQNNYTFKSLLKELNSPNRSSFVQWK